MKKGFYMSGILLIICHSINIKITTINLFNYVLKIVLIDCAELPINSV